MWKFRKFRKREGFGDKNVNCPSFKYFPGMSCSLERNGKMYCLTCEQKAGVVCGEGIWQIKIHPRFWSLVNGCVWEDSCMDTVTGERHQKIRSLMDKGNRRSNHGYDWDFLTIGLVRLMS
ncbi:hypothetical protein NPIL_582921 [Nephila pilipes]|uniref:Uncharacterized protein n=1 Tax=Nephila pilipes TaxID=299642 RepID=A0A8X6PBT2_NEPPI|nr:hypothetical protein NPIL_582921 [Nephila pilipes]